MKKITTFALMLLMAVGAWAATYDISQSAWQGQMVTTNNNGTYKGTGQVSLKIPAGGTIYLSNIDLTGVNDGTNGYGISCEGNATIYLMNTNKVTSGSPNLPAIYVKPGYTLTITVPSGSENASLTAKCDETAGTGYAAGIGASRNSNCGNIVINGGKVTAIGGRYGAGIGGAYNTNCGTITVTKYATLVTAARGASATCSIGKGYNTSTSGTVTIAELVRPNGITKQSYTYTPWDGNLSTINDDVVAFDGTVITGMFSSSASSKYGVYIANGAKVELNQVNMPKNPNSENRWAMINCLGDATIMLEGENYLGYIHGSYPCIYIPKNKTLTIDSEKGGDLAGKLIAQNTECTVIGGGYELDCGNIIIKGGDIDLYNEMDMYAVLGGGHYGSCGYITVYSTVARLKAASIARNYEDSKIIGQGHEGTCGTVTIAGTVYPDGILENPFIYPTPAWDGDLSTVTTDVVAQDGTVIRGTLKSDHKISIADGAKVFLYDAKIPGDGSVGIGPDSHAAITCEGNATIELYNSSDYISDNFLQSYCNYCPAIYVPEGKTLTIQGKGKLTAVGNYSAAAIGPGMGTKNGGNVKIKDGIITATAGEGGAAIGGGTMTPCGDITITGGTITATGGKYATGIGSGAGGSCSKVQIERTVTKVTATRGAEQTLEFCIGSTEDQNFFDEIFVGKCEKVHVHHIAKNYFVDFSSTGGIKPYKGETYVYEPEALSASYTTLADEIEFANNYADSYRPYYPSIIATLQIAINAANSALNQQWYYKEALDEAYNTLHAALQTAAEEIEQAQGIENVQSDKVQNAKVMIDGTLYIMRDAHMYDATGTMMK